MTIHQIRQQIDRFRVWASQSEALAAIPKVTEQTSLKGQAMADAYRHCANTLEHALAPTEQLELGQEERSMTKPSPMSRQ